MFPETINVHVARISFNGDDSTNHLTDYTKRYERFVSEIPQPHLAPVLLWLTDDVLCGRNTAVSIDIDRKISWWNKRFDSRRSLLIVLGVAPKVTDNNKNRAIELTRRTPGLTTIVSSHITNFFQVFKYLALILLLLTIMAPPASALQTVNNTSSSSNRIPVYPHQRRIRYRTNNRWRGFTLNK